jgi:hypothetical protein
MNSTIYSIGVNIFEMRFILSSSVFNLTIFVKFCEPIFITFVLNKYRIEV